VPLRLENGLAITRSEIPGDLQDPAFADPDVGH
jgi:hypothetical protein